MTTATEMTWTRTDSRSEAGYYYAQRLTTGRWQAGNVYGMSGVIGPMDGYATRAGAENACEQHAASI